MLLYQRTTSRSLPSFCRRCSSSPLPPSPLSLARSTVPFLPRKTHESSTSKTKKSRSSAPPFVNGSWRQSALLLPYRPAIRALAASTDLTFALRLSVVPASTKPPSCTPSSYHAATTKLITIHLYLCHRLNSAGIGPRTIAVPLETIETLELPRFHPDATQSYALGGQHLLMVRDSTGRCKRTIYRARNSSHLQCFPVNGSVDGPKPRAPAIIRRESPPAGCRSHATTDGARDPA